MAFTLGTNFVIGSGFTTGTDFEFLPEYPASPGRDIEQLDGGTVSLAITLQAGNLREAENLTGSLALTIAKSGTLRDTEQLLGAVSLVTTASGVLKESEQLDGGLVSLPTSLSGAVIEAEQLSSSVPDFYDLLALSGFFNEIEQLPWATPTVTIGLSGTLPEAEQLPSTTLTGVIALSGTLAEAERLGGYKAYIYIPLPVEGTLRETEFLYGGMASITIVQREWVYVLFPDNTTWVMQPENSVKLALPSDGVTLEQADNQVYVEIF